MFETILLAVDGSEHGQHAAKVAGDLARAVKASELRIVVAFEAIPIYLGEPNLSQAIIARKGDNEFAVSLIGDKAREAMTRRVYSDQYGKPLEQISASQVFAGILQRLAR